METKDLEAQIRGKFMKYDYKCRNCDNLWEENHSMTVNNPVEELGLMCPNCSSVDIHKYLGNYGTATVVFKGVGWAGKDLALKKIGMPEATLNNPETRKALNKNI